MNQVEQRNMTHAEARQATDKICEYLAVAWDTVIDVYNRRGWAALGYETWREYCDAEFGARPQLPRDERRKVTAMLRGAGMSTGAVGAAMGISQRTAAAPYQGEEASSPDRQPVTGLDGKVYGGSRGQKQAATREDDPACDVDEPHHPDAKNKEKIANDMTGVLAAALDYIGRGWGVFPLNGKVPAVKGGFKAASTDPDQIREWFGTEDHNIGLAIPKGHLVLDVDPRAGGRDTLHGIRDQIPEPTLIAMTGRQDYGMHIWLRGKLSKQDLPGIDIKRPGKGYVVAPPSIHPDTGYAYEWHIPDTPIATLEVSEFTVPASRERLRGEFRESVRDIAESVEAIPAGTRNDAMLQIAAYALGKYNPHMARLLYDNGLARCDPPLPSRQAESIWNWVYERQEEGDGFVDIEDFTEPDESDERRFIPINWYELLTTEPPEPDWLIEPILEAGRQVALYSEAKVGKSLLMLEIACGVATGQAVLGDQTRKARPVVYIDLENTTDDLRERVLNLGYKWYELENQLFYYQFPSLRYLDTPEGGREVYSLAAEHGADLVVIDTLARVTEGDENENDTYHNFYKHTGVALKRAGVTLARLDHAGKDANKGMRGASAKTTDVDAVWSLVATGDILTLTRTHSRNAHGAGSLVLERHDGPLRHVPPAPPFESEPQRDRVTEIVAKLDELEAPISASNKTAKALLREAGVHFRNDVVEKANQQRKTPKE